MNTATTTRQNKIETILDCFDALRRGVQQPTIVQNDDGTFEYIPGAYLTDISYSGSRNVVTTVDGDGFGEFNLDTADDAELRNAAEWAADDWDWTASVDDDGWQ